MTEATDGLCPACLSENVSYDVVSYLSGVVGPDGGVERIEEDQIVCFDCGERAAIASRGGVHFTPETLMLAVGQLLKG